LIELSETVTNSGSSVAVGGTGVFVGLAVAVSVGLGVLVLVGRGVVVGEMTTFVEVGATLIAPEVASVSTDAA
jgi:hypothetical protein